MSDNPIKNDEVKADVLLKALLIEMGGRLSISQSSLQAAEGHDLVVVRQSLTVVEVSTKKT